MRSSACDTLTRLCVRRVLCWLAFPLASALGSTGSAAVETALFVGFPATMAESDFSRPCIIGYGSSPSRCGPGGNCGTVDREISRFPRKERLHMPGSSTTPGRSDLAMVRPKRVAFRTRNGVGTRGLAFAAQWLAYALPYRRFVAVLADANAQLGADVDRSGRIEARTGLRMMPTSPRSPLSFRTAGFPRYGWKAGLSDGAFPIHRPT